MKTMVKKQKDTRWFIRVADDQVSDRLSKGYRHCPKKCWKMAQKKGVRK